MKTYEYSAILEDGNLVTFEPYRAKSAKAALNKMHDFSHYNICIFHKGKLVTGPHFPIQGETK